MLVLVLVLIVECVRIVHPSRLLDLNKSFCYFERYTPFDLFEVVSAVINIPQDYLAAIITGKTRPRYASRNGLFSAGYSSGICLQILISSLFSPDGRLASMLLTFLLTTVKISRRWS